MKLPGQKFGVHVMGISMPRKVGSGAKTLFLKSMVAAKKDHLIIRNLLQRCSMIAQRVATKHDNSV